MTLHLGWATHEAARHACLNWHYSQAVPAGRLVKVGVWEAGEFRGVVIFSRGSTPRIGSPYGLLQTEVCELTRVALRDHVAPVSKIIAIALRLLKQQSAGLRLVVSYAAGERGHHGGIYQAGGWVYEGPMPSRTIMLRGKATHARTISSRYGRADLPWLRANIDPAAEMISGLVRHKYLKALDAEMSAQIGRLAQPYPKRTDSLVSKSGV